MCGFETLFLHLQDGVITDLLDFGADFRGLVMAELPRMISR